MYAAAVFLGIGEMSGILGAALQRIPALELEGCGALVDASSDEAGA
jgi:hypothetical protein